MTYIQIKRLITEQYALSALAAGLSVLSVWYVLRPLDLDSPSSSIYQAHFLQRQLPAVPLIDQTSIAETFPHPEQQNTIIDIFDTQVPVAVPASLADVPDDELLQTEAETQHAAPNLQEIPITERIINYTTENELPLGEEKISDQKNISFPAFEHASFPVSRAPDWGAMHTPAAWERPYSRMTSEDFTGIPAYDLSVLTTPLEVFRQTRNDPASVAAITAKLFYSTRFFGAYDVDAAEFSGNHPGIDIKLPEGMPVGSVAGGRVLGIGSEPDGLGTYIMIEHRLGNERYVSIYAHLSGTAIQTGDTVKPGQTIGYVGTTGQTTGPHLHLQIDRMMNGETSHNPYWPANLPSRTEAALHTVHPIEFIHQY